MRITNLKIKNYRSIESLNTRLDSLTMLCGPNGSGKSNILKAITLAFSDISLDKRVVGQFVRDNITKSKLNSSASIQVELWFSDAPISVLAIAQETKVKPIVYKFKLTKSGNVTRKLGRIELDDESFKKLSEKFSIVYIPTIRDLENDGLRPFLELFKKTIQTARGGRELTRHLTDIKTTLSKKAALILGEQKAVVQNILNARAIELSTAEIELDDLYDNLKLQIKDSSRNTLPMEYLGTGHQSAVIINLYKQFGENSPGQTTYLFEEPDAHLHPPTIRAIGSQLDQISISSQVVVSTHSPILLSQLGLEKALHLKIDNNTGTKVADSNLSGLSQTQLNHRLLKYGLRVTEALFSKLVVIVEGGTDAIVVGRLIEIRSGKSSDQMDLLLVPATGKENIVDIAEILQKLGVKWIAIFDFDAALTTSSVPITLGGMGFPEVVDALDAIDNILADIDTHQKRGRKARTQFELIKKELEDGIPKSEFYDNSTLQDMMERVHKISGRSAAALKSAIRNGRIQVIRQILSARGIWLIRPDLEYTLVGRNNGNLPVIDPILRRFNKLNALPGSPGYERAVVNSLHSLSSAPEILVDVVDAVDSNGGFSRTDINLAVKQILKIARL
ncbi:ATP-dependent nuclease [Congregibacter litoralis]|uniref:AAA domain protein n=1 Tax=Congregibacter litoralis KT71 TaxID=314285 RepID=A4AD51_9GAMM|nr:AAA family ATPase [Congregibacter litoralis]EAQ96104.1 AAA domain protein [Congregibacter litoralis KT71]